MSIGKVLQLIQFRFLPGGRGCCRQTPVPGSRPAKHSPRVLGGVANPIHTCQMSSTPPRTRGGCLAGRPHPLEPGTGVWWAGHTP